MNLINKVLKNLDIQLEELAHLLKLSREEKKELKQWAQAEDSKIPKRIQSKLLELPKDNPFKFKSKNPKFKFIDLFAGIGGVRLAFQKEQGECVFSSEWDSKAATTYKVNFGEAPSGDITKIDEKDIPDFDILLGGFPCQAFSNAGLKKGFEDTRGTLFFEIARIIKYKKPKAILLENVKGLLSHEKGKTFETIKATLDELGYDVSYKVLSSKDYGTPQNRQRIMIVGFNRNKVSKEMIQKFEFPQPFKDPVKVGDILDKNSTVDEKYTISDKLWQGHQNRKLMHKEKGNGFGYSLFNKNSPYTNTISARYYKDGSEALIDQADIKENPRKLTPRECARLQGFPENYLIPVSDVQSYKQFGNSVTVSLINAVAKQMLKVIK